MNMKVSLDSVLKQAQQMQSKMQVVQETLERMVVTGSAGDNLVQITMNGRHDALKVSLDPLVLQETKEVIEELIAAAINATVKKIEQVSRHKLGELTIDIQASLDTDTEKQ